MELTHAFFRRAGTYFVLRVIISLQNKASVAASNVFRFILNTSTYSNCTYNKDIRHILQLWLGDVKDLWNVLSRCNFNSGNWQLFSKI